MVNSCWYVRLSKKKDRIRRPIVASTVCSRYKRYSPLVQVNNTHQSRASRLGCSGHRLVLPLDEKIMRRAGRPKTVTDQGNDQRRIESSLIVVAAAFVGLLVTGESVAQPAQTSAQAEKAVTGGQTTPQPEVPAPELVNADVPNKRPADPLDGPPFVTAKTWAIADGRTGAVLWGHDEGKRVDIASTTKIMTAFVVLRLAAKEPAVLDETVTFSRRADTTIGSASDVQEGEQVPVRELLYGLLLPSGNDAAVAFAEHFGSRMKPLADASVAIDPLPRFIAEMNRTAAELGLRDTHFVNPNGLTAPEHQSSARDLAKLTHHALALSSFARYVSTRKHGATVQAPNGRKRNVVWTNTNRLLDTEGYDGVKTGTTRAAGECLVASGRRNGDHLIVVILGASSTEARYADARNLFRYAWLMRGQRADSSGSRR
jgi:D-alanyl-D-alanine carboxypeptidase (penicillin-binding protein 5/6)